MNRLARLFDSTTMDTGRVLAATAIFYFHVGGLAGPIPLSDYGEMAVQFFVVLSGVSYVLFSKKPDTPHEYFIYLKKRLASLLPLFLTINVLLFLGSYLRPSALGRPYSVWEFLASASGGSMYLGWKFMSNVMWFVPFIMQTYLLIPFVDKLAQKINPLLLVLSGFGVSLLLSQMVPNFAANSEIVMVICKWWSPVFRLPEVCVGIILGRMALGRSNQRDVGLAIVLLGVLAVALTWLRQVGFTLWLYLPWEGVVVPVILWGGAALLQPLSRMVNAETLRMLGLSSFAFFLFHSAFLNTIKQRFGDKILVWILYYFACWVFAIILTVGLGAIKKKYSNANLRQIHS